MSKMIAILIFLVAQGYGGSAMAEDNKAKAKKHFESGVDFMKTEDFDSAAAEFERSVELFPTKSGLFNLANCYKGLQRYGKALTTIRTLHREFGDVLEGDFKQGVDAFEKTLAGMVAELIVEVDRDGATVEVDGEKIGVSPLADPLLLSPGKHEVTVRLEGYTYDVQKVKLLARDGQSLSFTGKIFVGEQDPSTEDGEPVVTESEKARGRPSALFWTGAAGTVVAGVLSGVFFGLRGNAEDDFNSAQNKWTDLSEEEQASSAGDGPWKDMKTAGENYDQYNTVAIVSAVAAGVFAVSSVVILVTDLKDGDDNVETAARVRIRPTLGGLGVCF